MPIPPRDAQSAVVPVLIRDRVLSVLERALLDGTLCAGDRLRDAELVEWLGTSRTPIREALLLLEAQGLVTTQRNRATRVAEFDARAAGETASHLSMIIAVGQSAGCSEACDAWERTLAAAREAVSVPTFDVAMSAAEQLVQSLGNSSLLDETQRLIKRARFQARHGEGTLSMMVDRFTVTTPELAIAN